MAVLLSGGSALKSRERRRRERAGANDGEAGANGERSGDIPPTLRCPMRCSKHQGYVVRGPWSGVGLCGPGSYVPYLVHPSPALVRARRGPSLVERASFASSGETATGLLALRPVGGLARRMTPSARVLRPLAAVARPEVRVSEGSGRNGQRSDCEGETEDPAHGNPPWLLIGPSSRARRGQDASMP
jgi:hypothetical protein